jgi:site-specific DNA-methyltransferase (adenine-specific)
MNIHKWYWETADNQSYGDQSVQLIITSPPYWQLKDYGTENQVGFHDSYENYINNLNLVWKECHRVLSDGCRMCINIGDQFARSAYYGRYKVIPIRTQIIRFCEALGMDYMGAVIWQKATTMNTTGGGAVMGSFPYPRNGILKIDYEFILIFKKLGTPPKVSPEQKMESKLTREEWNEYFSSHWYFPGVKQSEHLAMFPEELPRRLIKMFSFAGETVFDPFLGSGTTSLAASRLNRNSIGYEINPDYIPVIKEKLGFPQSDLFNAVEFCEDFPDTGALSFDVLPYRYIDPHRLDKKTDIKKQTYGSKIDQNTASREEFYSVKEVLSPNLLVLSGGLRIRLIGVKIVPGTKEEAISYLREKCRKRRVFLRFDTEQYDPEGNRLCYLYLDNKTFVNLHLIRSGFVEVDEESEYQHKKKFVGARKNAERVDIEQRDKPVSTQL